MRLKRHINEQEPWDGLSKRESLEQTTLTLFMTNILRDCQPFLRDLDLHNPKFLYSGRKRDTDWFEQSVRSDRKPKDLSPDIHTDFDNEFNKQFGWRPRSNGLFCTGDESSAYEYGNTFMIFPKGQYKILWSQEVSDLYIYIQRQAKSFSGAHTGNVLYQFIYNKLESSGEHQPDGDFVGKVTKEYNEFVTTIVKTYKSTGLKEAINSHKEIMINCQTYYAVRYNKWHLMLKEFFIKFHGTWPDSDDLDIWYKGRKK